MKAYIIWLIHRSHLVFVVMHLSSAVIACNLDPILCLIKVIIAARKRLFVLLEAFIALYLYLFIASIAVLPKLFHLPSAYATPSGE